MIKRVRWWVVLAMTTMTLGCSSTFLGPEPSDDPEQLFELFWQSYDRYYAHFQLKGLDWDQVYVQFRNRVGPTTTDQELFDVFEAMLHTLEDGHVYLVADDRRAFSDSHLRGARQNFDSQVVRQSYLMEAGDSAGDGKILFGSVNQEIGYIRLTSLSGGHGMGPNVGGWVEDLDTVLAGFAQKKALILDLRNNGGGRAYNAQFVANRFATSRRPFVVTRSRNGPRHQDFSPPITWYTQPHGGPVFDRPVVVLTNRFTFSAAEWLTLALRQFDHVIHMGTHSGGGLAMFLPRELPNGWTYTISIQDTRCPQGRSYERVGIAPHRYVQSEDEDLAQGRDTILEEAINFLQQQ